MLLDIEHLYGEHEGRLAPVLTSILLALAAPLLYVYFGLFEYIPIWLFAPIAIIIAIRVVLIIMGRESYRLQMFRRRMNDEWTSSAQLLNIRRIHQDGCVEYTNGKIFYAVCCYNGTVEDELSRTRELRKFLNSLLGEFAFDTYILNINNTEPLRSYYAKTHKFGRNAAGRNFVKIIDNSVELTRNDSMVQATVYCIKGTRSDWKAIRTQIDAAVRSSSAKCFKRVYRIDDPEELQNIIDMDADTNVNIDDLLRKRYQTSEYGSSKVLAYDPDGEIIIQGKEEHQKRQKKSTGSFYVKYQETEPVIEVDSVEHATAKPDYYKPITISGGSSIEHETTKITEESINSGRRQRKDKERSTGLNTKVTAAKAGRKILGR